MADKIRLELNKAEAEALLKVLNAVSSRVMTKKYKEEVSRIRKSYGILAADIRGLLQRELGEATAYIIAKRGYFEWGQEGRGPSGYAPTYEEALKALKAAGLKHAPLPVIKKIK